MQKTRAGHLLRSPKHVPLDVIGMDAKKIGGLGEILHPQLGDFIKNYRFFFNPIRYTSLGLAVIEAMMVGLPAVGLAFCIRMVITSSHG